MSKLVNELYGLSRKINKTASVIKDVEVVATGNPKKIIDHFEKKAINKFLHKQERKINNTVNKKLFNNKNSYKKRGK